MEDITFTFKVLVLGAIVMLLMENVKFLIAKQTIVLVVLLLNGIQIQITQTIAAIVLYLAQVDIYAQMVLVNNLNSLYIGFQL
jgi:hypothetical protein